MYYKSAYIQTSYIYIHEHTHINKLDITQYTNLHTHKWDINTYIDILHMYIHIPHIIIYIGNTRSYIHTHFIFL